MKLISFIAYITVGFCSGYAVPYNGIHLVGCCAGMWLLGGILKNWRSSNAIRTVLR